MQMDYRERYALFRHESFSSSCTIDSGIQLHLHGVKSDSTRHGLTPASSRSANNYITQDATGGMSLLVFFFLQHVKCVDGEIGGLSYRL